MIKPIKKSLLKRLSKIPILTEIRMGTGIVCLCDESFKQLRYGCLSQFSFRTAGNEFIENFLKIMEKKIDRQTKKERLENEKNCRNRFNL